MKHTLSAHYALNRYSYFLYLAAWGVFLAHLKLSGWVLVKDEILLFALINFFYFLWIFVYGSFHFREQAKVSRIDYQTLRFTKGLKTAEITKSDIAQIYIQKVENAKSRHLWYKVLVITKGGERYRFTYVSRLPKRDSPDFVASFLHETENFWGLAEKSMVQFSPSVFFCN